MCAGVKRKKKESPDEQTEGGGSMRRVQGRHRNVAITASSRVARAIRKFWHLDLTRLRC